MSNSKHKRKLVVCVLREVDSIEEGIAFAKEAEKRGWEGSVRWNTHSISGKTPSLQCHVEWQIEYDQADALHSKLASEFPQLAPKNALFVRHKYYWYGDTWDVYVSRASKCLNKVKSWAAKNEIWEGLPIKVYGGNYETRGGPDRHQTLYHIRDGLLPTIL